MVRAWSVGRLVGRSVGHSTSVGRSVGRLVGWSNGRWMRYLFPLYNSAIKVVRKRGTLHWLWLRVVRRRPFTVRR